MGDRSTEERHDAVADMLVDGAAESEDDAVDRFEEASQQAVGVLRIERSAQGGVAGEVDIHDADRAAICRRSRGRRRSCLTGQGSAAAAAEACMKIVAKSAGDASDRESVAAAAAKALPLTIVDLAMRTEHQRAALPGCTGSETSCWTGSTFQQVYVLSVSQIAPTRGLPQCFFWVRTSRHVGMPLLAGLPPPVATKLKRSRRC